LVEAVFRISLLPEELINDYCASRKISLHTLSKELGTMNTVMKSRKSEAPSRALGAFMELHK